MKRLSLVVLALALSGCVATRVCKEGGHDVAYIENSGVKLFNFIPFASGDPEYPNYNVALWFEDAATLENNMMLLDDIMRKRGYTKAKSLCSYRTDEIVIPLLLKRYIYHTSAELSK